MQRPRGIDRKPVRREQSQRMEAAGTKQEVGGVRGPAAGRSHGMEQVERGREDRHSLIRSATKARRLLLAPPGCTAVTFSM